VYRLTRKGQKRIEELWDRAHEDMGEGEGVGRGLGDKEYTEWGLLDSLGTDKSELEAVLREVGIDNLEEVLGILRSLKRKGLIEEV